MAVTYVDVDVRPTLRAGGEPFGEIMDALGKLQPGEGMRLFATFKPVPLFNVMRSKGFSHEEREIGNDEWEVLFTPAADSAAAPAAAAPVAAPVAAPPAPADPSAWPAAAREIDNRDLDPPEPMVRVLAATEEMQSGEVLCALLCREPAFLIPELEKRGHQWKGAFDADGTTYRIHIRIGKAA